MHTITLYWKNNDVGQPYFYLAVKAVKAVLSDKQDHYRISTSLPLEVESYHAVMRAAGLIVKCINYKTFLLHFTILAERTNV